MEILSRARSAPSRKRLFSLRFKGGANGGGSRAGSSAVSVSVSAAGGGASTGAGAGIRSTAGGFSGGGGVGRNAAGGGGGRANWSDKLNKRCMTTQELNQLHLCCPCPGGDTPYVPTCICVQQTPRVVCRKNVVWVQKIKQEPQVINVTRTVMIPKVVQVEKAIRVPEVIWTEGYVNAPRIEYRKQNVTTYEIRQECKNVQAPQEICSSFLCRPKPQCICIPPPTDYCCYPLDSLNTPSQCPPVAPYHPNEQMGGGIGAPPYDYINSNQPILGGGNMRASMATRGYGNFGGVDGGGGYPGLNTGGGYPGLNVGGGLM